MKFTNNDYREIKENALRTFKERAVAPTKNLGVVEDYFLTMCYAEAVVNWLRAKGYLNEKD